MKDRSPYSVDIRLDYHLLETWRMRQIGYEPEEAISYTVHQEGLPVQ